MTTTELMAAPSAPPLPDSPADRWRWLIRDGFTIARRDAIHWRRRPGQIVAGLAFPIMFVVLYGYVLGGSMSVAGGGAYMDFLIPGLFTMTMAFGVGDTIIWRQHRRGAWRHRSLPVHADLGRIGGAGPGVGRHGVGGGQPGCAGDLRACRGLAMARNPRCGGAGLRPVVAAAVLAGVGRDLLRAAGQEPGGGGLLLGAAVPAHDAGQHLRLTRADARLARRDRQLEPPLGNGDRDPGTVREPRGRRELLGDREHHAARRRLAGPDHADLAPLAVRRYRNRSI